MNLTPPCKQQRGEVFLQREHVPDDVQRNIAALIVPRGAVIHRAGQPERETVIPIASHKFPVIPGCVIPAHDIRVGRPGKGIADAGLSAGGGGGGGGFRHSGIFYKKNKTPRRSRADLVITCTIQRTGGLPPTRFAASNVRKPSSTDASGRPAIHALSEHPE